MNTPMDVIGGILEDGLHAFALAAKTYGQAYLENRKTRKHRRSGGKHTRAEWQALKERYDFTCLRCNRREPIITLTKDHVNPLGTNDITNIQPLCSDCNEWKGDRVIDFRT